MSTSRVHESTPTEVCKFKQGLEMSKSKLFGTKQELKWQKIATNHEVT